MFDSIIQFIIGDLHDKRVYKQMMKRVNALPKDYKFAFRKIQHYIYTVGSINADKTIFDDITIFTDLIYLFEASAAEGKKVIDVIGSDVDRFSDEFMKTYIKNTETKREKLNREIAEKFNKEGK